MSAERTPGFNTLAIHAGAQPDPATGARATPIYQTTSFVFDDVEHAAALFNLETFGNIYTRITNPTQAVLEERVAALEGGTAALAVASGHAAQALTFHTLLEPGDEFVAARQLYGGSINQFTHSFKKCGWQVRWADTTDPTRSARRSRRRPRRSLSNRSPIPAASSPTSRRLPRRQGGRCPVHRRQYARHALSAPPHEHGADIVVHSLTKFLGGHGNSIGGAIVDCGTFDWIGSGRYPTLVGAVRLLSRHHPRRDLRQFRLCHRLPRAGLARSWSRDLAVQRLSLLTGIETLPLAHAAPLRQRARRRHLARGQRQVRLGELCGAARQCSSMRSPSAIRRKAPAQCSPSG